jgi:hypothetical protein
MKFAQRWGMVISAEWFGGFLNGNERSRVGTAPKLGFETAPGRVQNAQVAEWIFYSRILGSTEIQTI